MKHSLKDYVYMTVNNSCDVKHSSNGCSRDTIINHFSINKGLLRISRFKDYEIDEAIDQLISDGKIMQGPHGGWSNWLIIPEKCPGIAKQFEKIRNKHFKSLLS